MSPSTKQLVFVLSIVVGAYLAFALGMLFGAKDATPLVGGVLGVLLAAGVFGLLRLAERLFPGDPS